MFGWIKERQLRRQLIQAETRLLESIAAQYDNYVDPLDALRDDDTGELWGRVGMSGGVMRAVPAATEQDLATIRDQCRALAFDNEFAINGIENRISYIVGSGHAYTATAKKGMELSEDQLASAQEVLDEFVDRNQWNKRQQEIVRRKDRDGECFLRMFVAADGMLALRFVEPDQVQQPTGSGGASDTFGIQTDPDDVETITGYWIDGEFVPAAQIQHRKTNVDMNVKRGLPLFYPVRKNLRRASKLLRNMSIVAEIQTAIAMIRKHGAGGTATGIQNWAQNRADASVTNTATGITRYLRQYSPGTILDTTGIDYEFPAAGIDGARYVAILQAELRAIAARLVVPEFMLTSDASNANFASTMVAEGPAIKMFERWQWGMMEEDRELLNRVLDGAVAAGRLDAATREALYVEINAPKLTTRERDKEVAADVALVSAKIMSRRTAMLRNDLDPDVEEEQIEQEYEDSMANNPFAGLGFGGQVGGGDDGKGNGGGRESDSKTGDQDNDSGNPGGKP